MAIHIYDVITIALFWFLLGMAVAHWTGANSPADCED